MLLTQCPSSRVVPDHFYDFLHKLFDRLDDGADKTVCLSGAFSLNAYGSIHRPISAIDMCVLGTTIQDALINTVGIDAEKDTSDVGMVRYKIRSHNDMRVCVYHHTKFPDNLGSVNIHGRCIQLYPAIDIIRYKIAMLSDRKSKMPEYQLRKHMSDIISFLRNSSKHVRQTFQTAVPMLVKSVNLYCNSCNFSTTYEVITCNDARYEGLTFDIRASY